MHQIDQAGLFRGEHKSAHIQPRYQNTSFIFIILIRTCSLNLSSAENKSGSLGKRVFSQTTADSSGNVVTDDGKAARLFHTEEAVLQEKYYSH